MVRKIRLWIRWFVVFFFTSTILAVVLYTFVPVFFTPLMFLRCGEHVVEGRMPRIHHKWVPMSKISPYMQYAVMAGEDQRFYDHHGFDWEGMKYAYERNLKAKAAGKHVALRGGSTISQQTAKNVFLLPSQTYLRKGLEAYFTFLIELCWSKERILEVYMNSIEMGDGIYGVESVAKRHFNKSAEELDRSDCALIAATLPNPRKFSSLHPSAYVQKRQSAIRRQMRFVQTYVEKNK